MSAAMPRRRVPSRWFDPILATAMLIACETEVIIDLTRDHLRHHWPLALNLLVVAFVTIPLAWRRRAPLLTAVIVMTSILLIVISLSAVQNVNSAQLVLFIVPYSVAAYSTRTRALLGLAYSGAIICAVNLISAPAASSWVFSVGVAAASWTIGRIIRSHRELAAQLQRSTDRIAAEREGRELLAIAEQRTRIARELQTLVAASVSTMIVQTQAAQRLLDDDLAQADTAMATIENTGRQALIEMRRILGVLRHGDEQLELTPQPGIGQIPALLEQARRDQRQLQLRVEGEPGPLPASVDLGVYRILEETIATVEDTLPIELLLRFSDDGIELHITSHGTARLDWPTIATRERVALCQGDVDVETISGLGERLIIRLPRVFEGALA